MSRKILFSGKRIDNDEWVYGDLLTGGVDFVCAIRVHGANENNSSAIIAVHPETVGQCTGVSDKNGKLMFEGDIVNGIFFFGHQVPGVVAFREGAFGLKWMRGNAEEFMAFCQTCNLEWEVVGNIYDPLDELHTGEGKGE